MLKLSQELKDLAANTTPEKVTEEALLSKFAEFGQVWEALIIKEHPILEKLVSEEYQQKLAEKMVGPAELEKIAAGKAEFGSFVLDQVVSPLLRKFSKGKRSLEGLHKFLTKADTQGGKRIFKALRRTPGVRSLAKAFVPKGNVMPSVTGPLVKAQSAAVPVLATLGLMSVSSAIARRKKMSDNQNSTLNKAASAIDRLVSENKEKDTTINDLQTKLAGYERKDSALEIAQDMVEKGMIDEEEVVKTAEKLVGSDKDLSIVKEGLAAVQSLGYELGTLHSNSPETGTAGGSDPLTEFLLENV